MRPTFKHVALGGLGVLLLGRMMAVGDPVGFVALLLVAALGGGAFAFLKGRGE